MPRGPTEVDFPCRPADVRSHSRTISVVPRDYIVVSSQFPLPDGMMTGCALSLFPARHCFAQPVSKSFWHANNAALASVNGHDGQTVATANPGFPRPHERDSETEIAMNKNSPHRRQCVRALRHRPGPRGEQRPRRRRAAGDNRNGRLVTGLGGHGLRKLPGIRRPFRSGDVRAGPSAERQRGHRADCQLAAIRLYDRHARIQLCAVRAAVLRRARGPPDVGQGCAWAAPGLILAPVRVAASGLAALVPAGRSNPVWPGAASARQV